MRSTFLIAALAAAGCVSAQTFYSGNAPGYERAEYALPLAAPGSFLSHGGAAFDPTGSDIFYWDVASGVIRRFDTAAGAPAAALVTVPQGPFGFTYVDAIVFDEFSTDIYIAESGNQVIHKVRRTGTDTIDPAFGIAGILTGAPFSFYLYDLKLDPFSRLLCSGANAFGAPENGIYFVDKTTLAAFQVVDLLTPGGSDYSGPIAFDSAGNLYSALPPTQAGDPMRVARWTKSLIDATIASGGATVLSIDDAAILIDWIDNFPNAGAMGFRHEDGRDILYFAAVDGGLYRSELTTRAFTPLATAGQKHPSEDVYPSALLLENPAAPFRPFSGDTARLAVVIGARDLSFEQVRHSICLFHAADAPAGVVSITLEAFPGAIASGVPFGARAELHDGAGMLIPTNGTVKVEIVSGVGVLGGRTMVVATGGVAAFSDLVLTSAGGTVKLRFSLVGGAASVDSSAVPVSASSAFVPSSDKDGDSGCVAGAGAGFWALSLVLVPLMRRRRV